MSRKSCAICDSGPEVAAAVERAVRNGEKLRDLEGRCGFSKSLISRHMRAHAALLSTKKCSYSDSPFLVRWPSGEETVQEDGSGEPLVEIVIEFEGHAHYANPAAVARQLGAQPQAAETSALKEPEEKPVEKTLLAKLADLFRGEPKTAPVEQTTPAQPAPAPECEHDFKHVSSDVFRCVHCGTQRPSPVIRGFSRTEFAARSNRFGL